MERKKAVGLVAPEMGGFGGGGGGGFGGGNGGGFEHGHGHGHGGEHHDGASAVSGE